jgi:hypothetical protein
MEPMLLWEEAGHRREDGPVWPGGAWSVDLSAQDRDLVAQDEDLGVLDACARASSPSQPKSWQKIRSRSLNVMLAMIASLHSPR